MSRAIKIFHGRFGRVAPRGRAPRYDQLDEAIGRANSLPYAFQGAVFTRSLDVALRAYSRLDASAVMVNDHTAFRVDWMPFAGLRQSGLGVGGIPFTFHDMLNEKMLVCGAS